MDNKKMFLIQNGIDVDKALEYMGDFETFNEILIDFYNGIDSQIEQLENFKNIKDLSNYAIAVHALKSNYRSLGATNYAEIAYQHEMESKASNIEYVNAHFSDLVVSKNSFKDIVSKYMEL